MAWVGGMGTFCLPPKDFVYDYNPIIGVILYSNIQKGRSWDEKCFQMV
jgi:hypothetical protein